jgi:NAD-dependent oxidoreductase involved in siderophore biosynthesis
VSGTFCAKHPKGEFLAKGTGHLFPADPYKLVIVGKRLKTDDPQGNVLIVGSIGPVAIHHLDHNCRP